MKKEETITIINNTVIITNSTCIYLIKRLFTLPFLLVPISLETSVVTTDAIPRSKKILTIKNPASVSVNKPKS